MRPGQPARHPLASQEEKYAYRHEASEYEESWPYEMLTGLIAMSEIVTRYALSWLTKWSVLMFPDFSCSLTISCLSTDLS